MKKTILIILFIAMYFAGSELSANRKAARFCDTVSIGENTESLQEDAIDAGARRSATNWETIAPGHNELSATFTGFVPGSDFICLITEKNGRVVRKQAHLARSILASIRSK